MVTEYRVEVEDGKVVRIDMYGDSELKDVLTPSTYPQWILDMVPVFNLMPYKEPIKGLGSRYKIVCMSGRTFDAVWLNEREEHGRV